MKQILIIITVAVTMNTAAAQSLSSASPQLQEYNRFLYKLQNNSVTKAQKTTAILQRVIAESIYEKTSTIRDTSIYKYSGSNGSKFDFNELRFITDYAPADQPDFYIGQANQARITVACDTYKNWQKTGSSFTIQRQILGSYNNGNPVVITDQQTVSQPLNIGMQHIHSYDVTGKLTEVLTLGEHSPSLLDSSVRKHLKYNSQNIVVSDSISRYINNVWSPVKKHRYTYDVLGRLTMLERQSWVGSPTDWINDSRYRITYTPNGKLSSVIYETVSGVIIYPQLKDTFEYANNSAYPTSRIQYAYLTNWEPSFAISTHMNAQGLPDTVIYDQWDPFTQSWQHSGLVVMNYNTDDNPEYKKIYAYTNNVLDSLPETNYYYYEQYNTTSIETVHALKQIKAFPNPCSTNITIRLEHVPANCTLQVTDLNGRTVWSEIVLENTPDKKIHTDQYAPGVYIMTLKDIEGKIITREKIVKL